MALLDTSIEQQFAIEACIVSATFADYYKARCINLENQTVGLWVTNYAMDGAAENTNEFIRRLTMLSSTEDSLSKMIQFGVDCNGRGFVAIPYNDGVSLLTDPVNQGEKERVFTSCLKLIANFHLAGISCGDITHKSFIQDRSGTLKFIGVLGVADGFIPSVAECMPEELTNYIAPELKQGGAVDFYSDVYSLGILACNIFIARATSSASPLTINEIVSKINEGPDFLNRLSSENEMGIELPEWFKSIVPSCITPDLKQRKRSADEILEAISSKRGELALVTKQNTFSQTKIFPKVAKSPFERKDNRKTAYIISALVLCMIFLSLGAYKFIFQNPKSIDYELEQIQNADPIFASTYRDLKNNLSGTEFNLKLYQALSLSDDPLAQHALVKSANYTEKYEERVEAEKFLFERARRQNFNETTKIIEDWCKQPEHYLHPYYLKILTFLEPSMPFEERLNLITELNQDERDLAKSLTTAIAFDTKQLDQYQTVLQKLIIQNQDFKNTENISTIALVMLDPHLSSLFEDSINLYREQLQDSDLLILFEYLALRNDINTRVVANIILKKGLLDNLASLPLQILIEKESLDSSVVRTLARVSLNNLSENDISALRSWYAIESEQTLLVILTKSSNKDLLLEAIDALVGKSPVVQPSAGILQWIRKYAWEERVSFAKVLGVLGLADRIDQEIVLQTLYSLDNYLSKPDFLELLLNSNSPALLEYLLTRHGQLIDIGIKINLLKHPNTEVRLAAVESIDTNDLNALRLVVSAYDTEKDPTVREKYNRFWMIKERENKIRDNNAINQ